MEKFSENYEFNNNEKANEQLPDKQVKLLQLQNEIQELKNSWRQINDEIKNLTHEDLSDFKKVFQEKMIKLNLPPETDLQDLVVIKNEYYQKIQEKEAELEKLQELE
ncbi:MAG: hypothetical protein KBI15_02055 [Candidatus Pacebacteria bacterium]|jgi:predicted nuclease with TOPRIM domain|nr:hypothetical protein [Candidatus Paceibacterota bacterium]MDD3434735.1 hypothetical protein [Candidatus Paceibacterota bacterium]